QRLPRRVLDRVPRRWLPRAAAHDRVRHPGHVELVDAIKPGRLSKPRGWRRSHRAINHVFRDDFARGAEDSSRSLDREIALAISAKGGTLGQILRPTGGFMSTPGAYPRPPVPPDGSPLAEAVLPFVSRLARPHGLESALLRVVPTVTPEIVR